MTMKYQSFSPVLLSKSLVLPLRQFFQNLPDSQSHLRWDDDPKKSKIDITGSNDLNKSPIGSKPRIIIDRGGYGVNKVGLSDNMANGKRLEETFGAKDLNNMVTMNGQAVITIDSPSEGECELITDMVSHFLVWSRPVLCNTLGFKEFALPLNVSSCRMDKSGKELFQVQIAVPWVKDEEWNVRTEAIKIKDINFNLKY